MIAVALLLCSSVAGVKEAVAYLEVEVPRWKAENGCYSCHNNGDAARALLHAGVRGPAVADTLKFLRDPDKWSGKDGKPDPLALVQYASALVAAGVGTPQVVLRRVVAMQKPDGHWEMDAEAAAGSPVTYGPVLGTVLARDLLVRGNFDTAAARAATHWLETQKAEHPMDIAALVMGLRRTADVKRLVALQAKDGSWNGGEAFDTAISVIALSNAAPESAARGREWLVNNQLQPGGWRGTTRPAGGQSYAQHISTTAWALQALLVTPPMQNLLQQTPAIEPDRRSARRSRPRQPR